MAQVTTEGACQKGEKEGVDTLQAALPILLEEKTAIESLLPVSILQHSNLTNFQELQEYKSINFSTQNKVQPQHNGLTHMCKMNPR